MKKLKFLLVIIGFAALTGFVKSDLQQGREHFLSNRLPEAVASFTKAILENPKEIDAYFFRGAALSAMRRFDEAIEDYNKVIELDPQHTEAYWSRGYCYQNKRMDDKAIADYTKSLQLGTKMEGLVHELRAGTYFRLSKFDEAERDLKAALRFKPGDQRILDALVDIRNAKADPNFNLLALEYRPIEEQPRYGERPLTPEVQRINDEFVREIMRNYETREEAAQDTLKLAWSLFNDGDYNTAMKRFNQAWLLKGDDPEIFYGYAQILRAWGYDTEAERWEQAAAEAGYQEPPKD